MAAARAAAAVSRVMAVVLHEDADAVEPAHVLLAETKEAPFARAGFHAVGAVPAWEIETWWLLFPDQTASVRRSWRTPDEFRGLDLGRIENSKEKLTSALRARGASPSSHDYEERDSPVVAEAIVASGRIREPAAVSASWLRFVDRVDMIERSA